MGDVFNEQIVKRNNTFQDTLKRAGIFSVVLVITVLSFTFVTNVAIFIVAALLFGAVYLMSYLNKEFEYVFTNGELDIDVIYNRSRRKRLFSVSVKDIEVMAHIEDKSHEHAFTTAQQEFLCHSGENGPNTYAFLAVVKGKKSKVVFEPNEKMLRAISTTLNRRKLHLRSGVVIV